MGSRIHLVVACSDRKTLPAPPKLHLRDVPGESVEERAEAWIQRLQTAPSLTVPADGLYAGLHWTTLLSLQMSAAKDGAEFEPHICSGGYGLIQWRSILKPYSATFTPGHQDSVARGGTEERSLDAGPRWWRALARWEGPEPKGPRSLRQIAGDDLDSAMVVVAGPHYLRAIREDLRDAAALLRWPERLILVSTGMGRFPDDCSALNQHLLACDARWEHEFRMARTGLSAAIAGEFLRRASYRAECLSEARLKMEVALEELPAPRTFDRTRMSEEEVRAFITVRLSEDPRLAFTVLLRELRTNGLACEYKRFRTLFRELQEALHAAES